MVQLLLDGGAAVDATTDEGASALQLAAGSGQLEKSQLLLEHGASPDLRDTKGRTPLHHAATALACVSQPPKRGRAKPPSMKRITKLHDGWSGMAVAVESVPGKGLGLVARRDLPPKLPVAYYYVKIYDEDAHVMSDYALGRSAIEGSRTVPDWPLAPLPSPH